MSLDPEPLPHLGDRYLPVRLLGAGGMGRVYLADDVRHGLQVAVKILARDLSGPVHADRFHREIRIAARLSHPHILPVFDSGEIDGRLYYVMPYVEGETLRGHPGRGPSPAPWGAGPQRAGGAAELGRVSGPDGMMNGSSAGDCART